jgi:CRISPR-associated protein Cas8a1/Csx13
MTELAIRLADPGMTPFLKAGLGGLASSLRAILRRAHPKARWPSEVEFGPGKAMVESRRVVLSWPAGKADRALKALFEASFRLADGVIDLPGTYEPGEPRPLQVRAEIQRAYKATILQHGKFTKKRAAATVSVTIDERNISFEIQRYKWFVQQTAWEDMAAAVPSKSIPLAGWAHPGAAQRHVAFGKTRWFFAAPQALCACFAIVGCLAYNSRGGALVVLEPADLVRFAELRPLLTPKTVQDTYVSGIGDAVLAVELALRMEQVHGRGVGATEGMVLRATPWSPQQKSRVMTLTTASVSDAALEAYVALASDLPPRLRIRGVDGSDDDDASAFVTTSGLRGFMAENLAAGRQWYSHFATETTGEKKPRFIHYYRSRDRENLGALWPEERKGLIHMVGKLEETEEALVRSVHTAIRQRFGRIASESPNPATRHNRWESEREHWRLAFRGAKTPDQIRSALADLWSYAGTNRELQERWHEILPLLRPDRWQAARDLALVALASYAADKESNGQ